MTNFAWWASQSPPGTFMCCLCFEVFPVTLANPIEGGFEDVCLGCAENERKIMELKGEA